MASNQCASALAHDHRGPSDGSNSPASGNGSQRSIGRVSTLLKPSGATPTTRTRLDDIVSSRPMTDGSPSNCRRHNRKLMTATG